MDLRDRFYSAINATPFSEKGKSRLKALNFDVSQSNISYLREQFFSDVYITPIQSTSKFDEHADIDDADLFDWEEGHLEFLRERKNTFERKVLNCDEAAFLIIGTAGSGKTTYLNWLFDRVLNKNQNLELINIDFESKEVRKVVALCGGRFDFGELYYTFEGRLSSAMLVKINQRLSKRKTESDGEYRNRLLMVYQNYKDVFLAENAPPQYVLVDEFFKVINDFALEETQLVDFVSKLAGVLYSVIQLNSREWIETFIQILIKVIVCCSVDGGDLDNRSHIIAFDNVERLMDEDHENPIEIQEQALCGFVRGIKDAIAEIDSTFDERGAFIRKKLTLLLSIRDTTATLSHATTWHLNDDDNSPLNITDWNDSYHIYESKRNVYLHPSETELHELHAISEILAFHNIMEDSPKTAGLRQRVRFMYNQDVRRISEALRKITDQKKSSSIIFETFNKLWWNLENVPLEEDVYNATKHLCRQAVLRVFYNLYNHQGLFEAFKVGGRYHVGIESSYARKVLTYLYYRNPKNKYDEEDNYIPLSDLVLAVLKPANAAGYNGIADESFHNLAEIFNQMTDIKMLPNFWAPLVEIIVEDSFNKSYETILETIMDLPKCEKAQIKLTNAGRAYAYFNADYEYFAARYNLSLTPLICEDNFKRDNNTGLCRCIIKIGEVRDKARVCINELLYNEKQLYEGLGKRPVIEVTPYLHFGDVPHPVRVVRQHVGYLNSFKIYVEKFLELDEYVRSEILYGKSHSVKQKFKTGNLCGQCKEGNLYIKYEGGKNCEACLTDEAYEGNRYITKCILSELDEYYRIIKNVIESDQGIYFTPMYMKAQAWLGYELPDYI